MTKKCLVLILLVLSIACTAVDYKSPRFGVQADSHQTIAVVPFEMIFTGKAPAGLSARQIQHIEEVESLAFQTSLYYRLLNRVGKGRIRIDVQPVEETNRILDDNGIDVRETWVMRPEELADVLGVDAVVRTWVKKTRYISDGASFGIHMGNYVAYEITEGWLPWVIPPWLAKTHDIFADSSLVNGHDGALLWKVAVRRETDWTRPANDVIEGITKKLAKKFPYRNG